jgi:hypothetical protein
MGDCILISHHVAVDGEIGEGTTRMDMVINKGLS